MKNLVYENEKLIEIFNINEYLDAKLYQVAASLGALETTNEIAKCFIDNRDEALKKNEHIMRLYALLQGLFVSIDSLYALTIALTKSKNYININNNKNIRQIKYIRNDIVGHPSNRILGSNTLAYCILDDSSIDAYHFTYNIYSTDGIIAKDIYLDDLLEAYYAESNNLLKHLYELSKNSTNKRRITSNVALMVDTYLMGGDYTSLLNDVITKYKHKYPNATNETNRVLWRYSLIEALENLQLNNKEEYELANYCIGLELAKIYKLITDKDYSFKRKLPRYVSAVYKFFKQTSNKDYISNLADSDNPIYKLTLKNMILEAENKEYISALAYFKLLFKYLNAEKYDIVYALNLPIKEYNRK